MNATSKTLRKPKKVSVKRKPQMARRNFAMKPEAIEAADLKRFLDEVAADHDPVLEALAK